MTKLFVDGLEADDATLEPTEMVDPHEEGHQTVQLTRLVNTIRRMEFEATVWVTRDGQRVHIRDMDDAHLQNTVRYLRRQGRKRYGSRPVLTTVLSPGMLRWRERLRLVWLALRSVGGRRPGVMYPHFPKLLAELSYRGLQELQP